MSDGPTSGGRRDADETAPIAPGGRRASVAPRIAHYTIVRVLGEGGMGTVYEARQDKPDRAVALKVVRANVLSPEMLRRFEHESQVLGRLQHPGIAQVYEAGVVHDERGEPLPFFAMELVRGLTLTRHAEQKRLGTRERLELIARVCDAIEHAHQKGVIHRDLKPGNILVDETGQPKVLDFGVARATDSDLQTTTMRTDIGQLIGTVPYMSPEQVSGDPGELDTRSDVYALGVIAYELLAGRPPYDLSRRMIHEAVRVIREEEPTRLSSINRTLRGDVETIVAKALEKTKVRRYPSAESLGSDIRRYLRDEPIAARPASAMYQVRKFSRRNRGLVSGVLATFAVLLAGLGVSLYAFAQARQERDAKEQERSRAEAALRFVIDSLRSGDPTAGGGQSTTILDAMGNAIAGLDEGRFAGDPRTEATLQETIGTVLTNNSGHAQAEALFRKALDTRRRLAPAGDAGVLGALGGVVNALYALGRAPEAEPLAREALDLSGRVHPGDHADTATALQHLGMVHFGIGRVEEAEREFVRALDMRTRLFPGDHADVAESVNALAIVRYSQGRIAEALPLYERALSMNRRLHPGDHPNVASAMGNLADAQRDLGRADEAEALMREALEMRRRLYKRDHAETANNLNNLALVLQSRGRLGEADPLLREALEMYQRLYPGDHPDTAWTLSNICNGLVDMGRPDEAAPFAGRALDMRRRLYPGDHPELAQSIFGLANVLRAGKHEAQAEPLFVEALAMQRRLHKGDHPDIVHTLRFLAGVRGALGRDAEAEPLCREGVEMSKRLHAGDHPSVALAYASLAQCLGNLARWPEAMEAARLGAEMAARIFPEGHRMRQTCERALAEVNAKAAKAGK